MKPGNTNLSQKHMSVILASLLHHFRNNGSYTIPHNLFHPWMLGKDCHFNILSSQLLFIHYFIVDCKGLLEKAIIIFYTWWIIRGLIVTRIKRKVVLFWRLSNISFISFCLSLFIYFKGKINMFWKQNIDKKKKRVLIQR